MSVGKSRDGRQLEFMKTKINSFTEVKTNTHTSKINTKRDDSQVAKPAYERILLGIDQHAADLRIVRQLDGAGTQPPQRIYPGADLQRFVKKQLAMAQKVYAVYEAGPCGFVLARQLKDWGVDCYVIRPMKLDTLGKGVNTDKTDAAELVSRLDRYLAGNRKALAVVRVPTPEEEQRRCVSRQREQLRRQRQRLGARGRSLMLCQGYHCKLRDWWQERQWLKLVQQLPGWLVERLTFFRTVLQTVEEQLEALTNAVKAQVPKVRPLGCGPLTLATATNEVGDWDRFNNRRQVGSLAGLCGGVSSSGPNHVDLSITKHGNARLRYLLIELAWRMVKFQPQCKTVQKWKHILLAAHQPDPAGLRLPGGVASAARALAPAPVLRVAPLRTAGPHCLPSTGAQPQSDQTNPPCP
jgi:transposase